MTNKLEASIIVGTDDHIVRVKTAHNSIYEYNTEQFFAQLRELLYALVMVDRTSSREFLEGALAALNEKDQNYVNQSGHFLVKPVGGNIPCPDPDQGAMLRSNAVLAWLEKLLERAETVYQECAGDKNDSAGILTVLHQCVNSYKKMGNF